MLTKQSKMQFQVSQISSLNRGLLNSYVKTLIYGDPTSGWPSMICIVTLIGGIQLFCMGIIGQYLAKTYLESKNRPVYIMGESSLQKQKGKI